MLTYIAHACSIVRLRSRDARTARHFVSNEIQSCRGAKIMVQIVTCSPAESLAMLL